ncbi:hypothetical protein QFC20_006941 [Naganishia adeliensis]|uniref:Uncharacterized protein n=1 Tax=Naganishia adeliensis TaxID=92952 RepID=A0ACC2V4B1_9TREE|nr:hypothetical protein QFC20_006941 [Naganishia adeliensis]
MSVQNTTSPAAIPSPPAAIAPVPSEDIVARKVADFIVNTGIGFSVGVVSSVLLFRRKSTCRSGGKAWLTWYLMESSSL